MKKSACVGFLFLLLISHAVSSEELHQINEDSPLPPGAKKNSTALVLSSNPLITKYKDLATAESSLSSQLKNLEGANSGLRIEEDGMKLRVIFDSDILFDFDKHTLRPDAEKTLASVAQVLSSIPHKSITIVGHTDSVGSNDYNKKLSQKRAESVKTWLSKRAELKHLALSALGRGEDQPIAPNTLTNGEDNPDGRQKNRRVELEIPK